MQAPRRWSCGERLSRLATQQHLERRHRSHISARNESKQAETSRASSSQHEVLQHPLLARAVKRSPQARRHRNTHKNKPRRSTRPSRIGRRPPRCAGCRAAARVRPSGASSPTWPGGRREVRGRRRELGPGLPELGAAVREGWPAKGGSKKARRATSTRGARGTRLLPVC